MKPHLFLAVFLGFGLFWTCHLGPEDDTDRFDVVGDSNWTRCDTLELLLLGDSSAAGRPVLDTLFRAPLRSLGQLRGLDAGAYRGGDAAIRIRGFFRDGSPCVDVVRAFGDNGIGPSEDTLYNGFVLPDSIVAEPIFLSLVGDGGPQKVTGRVLPAYADQGLTWSMDSSGVATVDVEPGVVAPEATVSPSALGEGYLTLRSRKDPARTARVRVRVSPIAATAVFLDNDTLQLYARGPAATLAAVVLPHLADPAVLWTSGDTAVAWVDTSGRITPRAPGRAVIRAATGNGFKDSAVVTVVADVPDLRIAHKPGAPVNEIISFSPTATQKVGHLVLYAWDLQGDGAWDDSLALQLYGESVALPPQAARYDAEREYRPRFRVRDSEGNTAIAEAVIYIGNQPPEISGLPGDTVLSIRDSLLMTAVARDLDGTVVWAGWDYEGDGQFDDTLLAAAAEVQASRGHRYLEAGNYLAVFRAMDDKGKTRQDTSRIRVDLDPPVADAGSDIVVVANETYTLRVGGMDRLGTIVRREYKLGEGPFVPLSGSDTVLVAPPEPAELDLVVRVTDDDSLTAIDSAKFSVILSANSDLTGLVLSAGTLSPTFRPDVSAYEARVGYGDSLVHIVPTARDSGAELTVNGLPLVSGNPSEPVPMAVGANPGAFQVRVAALDGSVRTYVVAVTRAPDTSAALKALTGTGFVLRPAFAPDSLAYRDTVPASVGGITLRPTAAFPGATVTVDGVLIASGTPTPVLPLQFGDNFFRIEVVAEDGKSRTAYTVWVVRLAKLYIVRKLGAAPAVLADSAELPLGVLRPLSTAGITGHTFAGWTQLEGRSTLTDTAANPTTISVGTGITRVQAAYTINRYTLAASATGCGTMDPAPGTTVHNHGANIAFTLSPSAGCRISSVRLDGVEDTSGHDGTYAITNLSGNRTLQVVFARYYTLTGAVSGSGGTIWPMAAVRVDSGSGYTYVLNPDEGKKVFSLRDNGAAVAPTTSYSLQNIDADHHVEVVFAGGFTLTAVVALGAGTITPASVGVDSGASQVFRFRPAPSYRFLSLTDNGAAAAPIVGDTQYTLAAIDRAHALQVRFRRLYTLTVASRGCGTVNGAGGTVDSASSRSFTFAPAAGCRVDSVFVNNGLVGAPGSYAFNNIAQNASLRVVFTRQFTVATTWGTGATGDNRVGGSINPVNPLADSMDAVTLTLGVNIGYRRQSLTVNGAAVTPVPTTYTFPSVRANQSIRLGLIRTFTQTAAVAGGQGTVTPTQATVDTLASQTFAFAPAANYRLHTLLVNGAAVTPSGANQHVLANINRNNALQVRFVRQYAIAVTSSGCGTVSPPGSPLVDSAANQTYTFNLPNAACTVDTLIVDGRAVAPAASHTFTNVVANHTLRVVFQQDPLSNTVTTTWGTSGDNRVGGNITPANPSVGLGQPVTLSINPAAGYRRLSFSVNGAAITPVPASHTIASVTAPMTAHAAFLRTFVQTAATGLGAGSITPASQVVDTLGSVTFSFSPAANYRFHALLVNGAAVTPSAANQHTLTAVNRDNAVQARFWRQYTIATSATGCGTVAAGGVRDSASNNSIAFTIPAGCRLDSLFVNGAQVTPANPYAFNNLSQNQVLRAVFATTYVVSTTWGAGGSVTPANPVVEAGEPVTLTITPAAGYRRYAYTVNGTPAAQVTPTYTFAAVSANQTFHAEFRRVYRVTAAASAGGSVTPAQSDVDSGQSLTLTITPASGYVIDTVRDNGAVVITDGGAAPVAFSITGIRADHQVAATFRRTIPTYGFTVAVTGQGTASPASGSVTEGADQRIDFTAGSDFVLTGLTDNGRDVLGQLAGDPAGRSSYTLQDVSASHQIQAVFTRRAVPVFRLTLADSIVLGRGESGPEDRPRLCVDWRLRNDSDQVCGSAGLVVSIPEGSNVTLTAPEAVTVCSAEGLCEERPFSLWHIHSGQQEEDAEKNPHRFDMTADADIRAVYGAGLVILPVSGTEP